MDICTERQARIIELFDLRPHYTTQELSSILGVSRMTIRRDLQELAKLGILTVIHGGARLSPGVTLERDLTTRSREQQAEKRCIGAYAATLVGSGESIGIDAGSTPLEVARHLGQVRGLTVVTHSLPVMVELAKRPDLALVSLGGTLHHAPLSFSGPIALSNLSRLHLSTVFLGTSGIHLEQGLTSGNLDGAEIKRALLRAAERVVIVADSTKFGRIALVKFASLEARQILVTDTGLSDIARQQLQELGVEVHLVKVDTPSLRLVNSR